MSNTPRDCEHGQLARSCEICELRREIAELRAEKEAAFGEEMLRVTKILNSRIALWRSQEVIKVNPAAIIRAEECEGVAAQLSAEAAKPPADTVQDYKALYHDLIMQVGNKYPGESRHDTAKRYIVNAEALGVQQGQAAAEGKK